MSSSTGAALAAAGGRHVQLEPRDCMLFFFFLFYLWLLTLKLTKPLSVWHMPRFRIDLCPPLEIPLAVPTELDSDLHLKLRFLDHYGNEPRTMYIDCR